MKAFLKTVVFATTLVSVGNVSYAQLSGPYTVGSGTYTTLASIITALNTQGVSASVVVNIPAGFAETAPTGGYALGSATLNTSLSATKTLIFQKSGAGANPLITAYSGGTATPASAVLDGIWKFSGTDYVTIDGIDLLDTNSANPATMEYGYGLFKASATDGSQNMTIKNCTITLNRTNNVTGSGPVYVGSVGIAVYNSTTSASTTSVTVTAATGANSNNKFYSNTIQNCNVGIAVAGYAAASPFTLGDTGNDIGGISAGTGNTILNFGGASGAVNASAGIYLTNQYGFNVSYNIINNNNGTGVSHVAIIRGIYSFTGTGASGTITNNTVTIKNGGTTSQVSAIENTAGASGVGNTISITNNTITGCTNDLMTSGSWYGVWNSASAATVNLNNNVFTNDSTKVTTGVVYLVYNSGATAGTINMVGNSLSHVYSGATAFSGTMYNVYNGSGTAATTTNINNNTFSNYLFTTTSSSSLYFVYNTNGNANLTISGNKWNNLTLNHSSSIYLMYNSTSTQVSLNVTNDSVNGITRTASASTFYCYYSGASSLPTSTQNFTGNYFSNIVATTSGTGTFYGIYSSDGATSPYPRKTFANNTLANINYNSTGTMYCIYASYLGDGTSTTGSTVNNNTISNVSFTGSLYGIYTTSTASPTQPYTVYNNVVSGLSNPSSSAFTYGMYNTGAPAGASFYGNKVTNLQSSQTTGSAIYGMYFSTSTNTSVYNNMVSDIRTPTASSVSPIYGMYFAGGTQFQVYFNTIYLNPTSAGGTFGATGIYYAAAIGSFDLRNNIVNVNATPAGTGFVVAVRRDAGTSGTPPVNLALTSNSNIYYAPNASNSYLYAEGTGLPLANAYNLTNDPAFNTTCGLFKSLMVPRETSTFTENNLTQIGTTATYAPTGVSFAKNNAATTTSPAVTVDFNGVSRATPADVGGLQFTGTGMDLAGPAISYTPLITPTYCTAPPTLTATITDVSGVNTTTGTAPRIYYRKSSEVDTFGGANNNTFNGWKWVESTNVGSAFTFIVDYTKLTSAVVAGDSIIYFIIAQDLSTTPNVGSNVIGYPAGACPTSVALTAAQSHTVVPPRPNGYKILAPAFTLSASPAAICIAGTTTLTLSGVPNGLGVQWQQDNGTGTFTNIIGATGNAYTTASLTSTNRYRVVFSCGGSPFYTSPTDTIIVNNPSITSTTPATRCGIGTLTLGATAAAGNTINWYAAATGGTSLGTGTSFITPAIGATTTYYAGASIGGGGVQAFGKITPVSTSGNSGFSDVGLVFDAFSSFLLQSVDVYATGTVGTGSVTVALKNSAGTILQSTVYPSVTVTTGGTTVTTIPLNYNIVPGTAYRLVVNAASGISTLIRESSTTTFAYPYTLSGIASITSAYTGGVSASFYYYFYNWKAVTGCEAPRAAVIATVNPAPAIVVSSPQFPGICSGTSATLSVTSANTGYSYSWTPSSTLTCSTCASPTATPTTTTTYILTATDNSTGTNAGCVAKDSVTIAVSPQPGPPTITPVAASTICQGQYATLLATAPGSSNLVTLGTGTVVNTTTSYPTPYGQFYGSSHDQYIIKAAELTALGISAGNITSLAFDLQTGYAYAALLNFAVKMGNATATVASTTLICTPLTTVYSVSSYAPPATTGWATITFTTPFAWDGVSNVVVDVAFSNCSVCNGTSSCTTSFTDNGVVNQTTTSFVSTVNVHADANCTINSCTPSITGTTYSQRPNMQFNATKTLPVNWVNVTGLYKNTTLTTSVTINDTNKTAYASPPATQIYTAVTNSLGCKSVPSAPDTVVVNPTPITSITASGSGICVGQTTTTLTSGQTGTGYTYQWNNTSGVISGATSNTYTTGAIGSYTVTVTNTATGCTATTPTATTITAFPIPTDTIIAAGPTTFCIGSSVILNATAANGTGFTYQWQLNGANITSANSASYTATAAGNYTNIVTNGNGCVTTSNVLPVTVNVTTATITPLGSTTFCTGGNVGLQANGGANLTYQWQLNGAPITGATAIVYTATASGNYTVLVFNTATGCSAISSAVTVTVGPPPTSNITPATSAAVCDGSPLTLATNPAPGLTYQWYKNGVAIAGANGQTYTQTFTIAGGGGAFTVNVSIGPGCSSTTTTPTVVTVNPLPTISASAASATTFCLGGSVVLNAAPTTGLTYQWYNGTTAIAGATAASYSATASGSITVKATNGNGCVNTSSPVSVTVNPLPVVSTTLSGSTTFCQGGSVTLNANPSTGMTYQWRVNTTAIPGSTANTYLANNAGNYTFTATDANGCSNTSAPVAVVVNPLPNVNTTPSGSVALCSGTTTTISVPSIANQIYQWLQGGAIISGAGANSYTTGSAGNYSVIVTNTATTCQATSAPVLVTVNPLPLANINVAGPTTICQGDSVKFTANAGTGYTYQWNLNGNNIVAATGIIYNAVASGTYSVSVSNSFGCTVTSSPVSITVNPTPAAYITFNSPLSFCDGAAVVLNANLGTGFIYQWFMNGVSIGNTTPTNISAQTGAYTLKITNTYGCVGTSVPVNVTVWSVPVPVITMTNYVLSAGGPYATYQWFYNNAAIPGAIAQTHVPAQNGAYKVVVSDAHNCSGTSEQFFVSTLGISGTAGVRSAIKVYPNPASSILHIDAPVKVKLILRDVSGKAVLNAENVKELDITNIANGLYLLYVNDTEGHLLKAEKITKTDM